MLAALTHLWPLAVVALLFMNIGINAARPPTWSIAGTFLNGTAAAAGIATINSIGNLGGFVGPTLVGWMKEKTGNYTGGLYAVAALVLSSVVVTFILAHFHKSPTPIQKRVPVQP